MAWIQVYSVKHKCLRLQHSRIWNQQLNNNPHFLYEIYSNAASDHFALHRIVQTLLNSVMYWFYD